MASLTPKPEGSESQIMREVEFSEWLREDYFLSDSPDSNSDDGFDSDSDFDYNRLFLRNGNCAISTGNEWSSDLSSLNGSEVDTEEMKDVSPTIIKPHQESAQAILPNLIPESYPEEPAEATSPDSPSSSFKPRPAEEFTSDLVLDAYPQEPAEATSPNPVHSTDPITSEKPHDTEDLVSSPHKGLFTKTGPLKTGPRKESSAELLIIDLTGSEPVVISGIPSNHPNDDVNDIGNVNQGCRALAKNDDEALMERIDTAAPLSRKRKRPTSASDQQNRRKKTVHENGEGSQGCPILIDDFDPSETLPARGINGSNYSYNALPDQTWLLEENVRRIPERSQGSFSIPSEDVEETTVAISGIGILDSHRAHLCDINHRMSTLRHALAIGLDAAMKELLAEKDQALFNLKIFSETP